MKFFMVILLILFLGSAVLFLGDYYNVPLWPTNLFNRVYAMELRCSITDFTTEQFQELLNAEGGITLEILDHNHKPIRKGQKAKVKTDLNGMFRIYIPEGKYYVRAEILSYFDNKLHHFATGQPGKMITLKLEKSDANFILKLHALALNNKNVLITRLDRFLLDGNILAAKALLDEMLTKNQIIFTGKDKKLFMEKRADLNKMLELIELYYNIPKNHYISLKQNLLQIQNIFQKLLPNIKSNLFKFSNKNKTTVFIVPRLNAIERALTYIWKEYIISVKNFLQIRNYLKAFFFWNVLIKNPELYSDNLVIKDKTLLIEFEDLKEKMPEIKRKLLWRFKNWLEKGKKYYENNEINKAEKLFQKANKVSENLYEELELTPEQRIEIKDYVNDIQSFKEADKYIELKDWKKVQKIYSHITNESKWLIEKKKEIVLHIQEKTLVKSN